MNGRIEIRDPKTGARTTFVLSNNRLKAAGSEEKDAFTSLLETAKSTEKVDGETAQPQE